MMGGGILDIAASEGFSEEETLIREKSSEGANQMDRDCMIALGRDNVICKDLRMEVEVFLWG